MYGNWENSIDNYTLSYEGEQIYETLEYILELAQKIRITTNRIKRMGL